MLRSLSFSARTMLLLFALYALLPLQSYAQTRTCTDGSTSHPASAQEAASANGGIIAGVTQLCPEDAALGINAQVGGAKQYLNTVWCGGSAGSSGGFVSNVEQLDDKYAVCIAKFIQMYKQRDPSTCMKSAYRSAEHQQAICGNVGSAGCAAPNKSNHQRGIAVDLVVRNYQDMHQAVMQFPGGGLRFLTIANDPYHVEANNTGICGTGNAGANNGLTPIQIAQQTPMQQGAFGALQQLFSPPQPQQPPMPQQSPVTNPLNYLSPTQSGTQNTNTNVSNAINSNGSNAGANSGTSAFDLINAIANPTTTQAKPITATSTPVGTSVALNDTIKNQGVALNAQGQSIIASTSPIAYAQGGVPQTFTSGDLQNSQSQMGLSGRSTFSILENVKQLLMSVLILLRPFGGTLPTQIAAPAALE